MVWWKKQREEIYHLRMDILNLKEQIKELQKNQKKLERIIEHIGKGNTFSIDYDCDYDGYIFYLYIKNKEYSFLIKELNDLPFSERDCVFRVDGEFAYLDISILYNSSVAWVYHFIFHYKNGKHFCSKEEVEENEEETEEP